MEFQHGHFLFPSLACELTLRTDANFVLNEISSADSEYYRFNELFDFVSDDSVDIDSLGEFRYAEIGNVTNTEDVFPVTLNFDFRDELNEGYYSKIEKGDIIKVSNGDILISKIRPYLQKFILINEQNSEIYYTAAFLHIRPKFCNKILYYALKFIFIKAINSISRQGKGYPTLSESDLRYLKFDKCIIDYLLNSEDRLLSKIEPLESKIYELKLNAKSEIDIINEILSKEFGWAFDVFKSLCDRKIFSTPFSNLCKSQDLRFSAKFHRPSGTYVENTILPFRRSRIKNHLEIPICLGASISPSDFDSNGNCYYISMATIKNYKVELDDSQLVTCSFENLPKNQSKKVRKGDIIMSRSGAAIGKFALVENDCNAIFADFTMRIRLKDVNVKFAYYFFRSAYFQHLILIYYMGLQNHNIYPYQISEFPFPDISLEEQDRIVSLIDRQVSVQSKTNSRILSLRNQIKDIITEITL